MPSRFNYEVESSEI